MLFNSVIENLSGETFRVLWMDPCAEDVGCRHTVVMAASLLGKRGELEVEVISMLESCASRMVLGCDVV